MSTVFIPSNVQEALLIPHWKDAINVEMEALETTRSWKLAKLSKGKKVVGCKQVFTLKNKVDGSIKRYIARPAAKGFTQNTWQS